MDASHTESFRRTVDGTVDEKDIQSFDWSPRDGIHSISLTMLLVR